MLRDFISNDFGIFSGSIPDILAVREGIKPMARLSCSKAELSRGMVFLSKEGFSCERSDRPYGDSYYIYISLSGDTARQAKSADNSFMKLSSNRERARSVREFGKLLGYPVCCSDFLAKNMEKKGSQLREKFRPEGRLNFLANNILNGVTNHYFSFHYPCSYGCRETLKNAGRLYRAIGKVLPDMVTEIEMYLRSPFLLVFDLGMEYSNAWDTRKGFWFDGQAGRGEIRYNRAVFFGTGFPEYSPKQGARNMGELRDAVMRGNTIKAQGGKVGVYSNERLLHEHRNSEPCWASVFDFR